MLCTVLNLLKLAKCGGCKPKLPQNSYPCGYKDKLIDHTTLYLRLPRGGTSSVGPAARAMISPALRAKASSSLTTARSISCWQAGGLKQPPPLAHRNTRLSAEPARQGAPKLNESLTATT